MQLAYKVVRVQNHGLISAFRARGSAVYPTLIYGVGKVTQSANEEYGCFVFDTLGNAENFRAEYSCRGIFQTDLCFQTYLCAVEGETPLPPVPKNMDPWPPGTRCFRQVILIKEEK